MPAPPTSTVLTGAALYVPKIVAVLRELGGKAKTSIVRATIVDQMSASGEEIAYSSAKTPPFPIQTHQSFQFKPATGSDPNPPAIPVQTRHRF